MPLPASSSSLTDGGAKMEPMKSFTWWQACHGFSLRPSASLSGPTYLQLTFFLAVPGLQSQFRRSAAGCFVESIFNHKWNHPAAAFAPSLLVSAQSPRRHLWRIVLHLNKPLSLPSPRVECRRCRLRRSQALFSASRASKGGRERGLR